MFILPEFRVPYAEYRARQSKYEECGNKLKESLESYDFSTLDSISFIVKLPSEIPMASDSRWANRQFGAVNTVQNSACVAFVSKVILNFFGIDIPMEDLLTEIENKGYRLWRLADRKKKTLNMAYPNVEQIKKEFPEDDPIWQCKTLEEIYQLCGKPEGIGCSMFVIDNIINYIAKKPIDVYRDTRIQSIDKLLWNLEHGIVVPLRVQNSIYHDDPNRKEGHCVTLFGISHGKAIVVDTSFDGANGINILPAEQLINAMLWNKGLICAWDLSSCI